MICLEKHELAILNAAAELCYQVNQSPLADTLSEDTKGAFECVTGLINYIIHAPDTLVDDEEFEWDTDE